MSIENRKISDYFGKDLVSAPDILQGTAQENKARFDQMVKEVVVTAFNGLITDLLAETAAESVGAVFPGVTTNTLAAVLLFISIALEDRSTTVATDAKIATATNNLVQTVTFNEENGQFTITTKSGGVTVIDTNIEKIPIKAELITEGNITYLRITNDDGSYTQVNVSALMNDITFENTATVNFVEVPNADGGRTIRANVVAGSITLDKLDPSVTETLQNFMLQAEGFATQAGQSATNASNSAASATQAVTAAQGAANSASSSATSANTSAQGAVASASAALQSENNAGTNATLSKSWAVGGTGARADEAVNNAKYWSSRAAEAAGGGITGINVNDVPVPVEGGVAQIELDYLVEDGDAKDTTVSVISGETSDSLTNGLNLSVLFGRVKKFIADSKALIYVRNNVTAVLGSLIETLTFSKPLPLDENSHLTVLGETEIVPGVTMSNGVKMNTQGVALFVAIAGDGFGLDGEVRLTASDEGYAVAYAPTPPADSSVNEIATAAWTRDYTESYSELEKTKLGQAVYPSIVDVDIAPSDWVNGVATVAVAGVIADTEGDLDIAKPYTVEQLKAAQKANIKWESQTTNSVTLKCYGDVPTITIPLRFRVWRV